MRRDIPALHASSVGSMVRKSARTLGLAEAFSASTHARIDSIEQTKRTKQTSSVVIQLTTYAGEYIFE